MAKNVTQGRDETPLPAPATGSATPVSLPDLDIFMARVLGRASGALPVRPDGDPALLRRDYETAFNLLQRASEAFAAMVQRCERLEAEMRDLRTQAQADVAAAQGITEQWHELALVLKEKVDLGERDSEALRQRLATTEAELAAARRSLDETEQQARIAADITTLFHDKIVEAFGVGSQAHAALDLVARGDAGREDW